MRSFRTHLILHTIIQSWNCKTCHVPVVVVFHYLGEPLTAWEGGLANDKSINHGHGGFSVYPPCSSSSSSSSRLPSRGLPAEERTRRRTLTGHGSTSHGRRSDSWRLFLRPSGELRGQSATSCCRWTEHREHSWEPWAAATTGV